MPSRVPFSPSPRRRRLSRGRSFERERDSSRSPTEHELRPGPSRRAQLLRGRRYYSHRHGDGTLTRGSLGAPASTWELVLGSWAASAISNDRSSESMLVHASWHAAATSLARTDAAQCNFPPGVRRGPGPRPHSWQSRATQCHPEARCQYLWPHTGLGPQTRKSPGPPNRDPDSRFPVESGIPCFPAKSGIGGFPPRFPAKKNRESGGSDSRFPYPPLAAAGRPGCRWARTKGRHGRGPFEGAAAGQLESY